MQTLDGYTIHLPLHRGERTIVYQAVRNSDAARVVIKVARDGTRRATAASYQHERAVLEHLGGNGAPRLLALTRVGGAPALVLSELDGAEPLAHFAGESVPLLLSIFIRACEALRRVHARGIVHKGLSPRSILFSRARSEALLVDFASAAHLAGEVREGDGAPRLSPALRYTAPEQTGRMNRTVDARSDYYALGATFYELIAGRPPFEATDPIELVHAHIAVTPAPAHAVNPRVPPGLSDVLAKLLAKAADDRYQSLSGLCADLHRCARAIDQAGTVAPFPLGSSDVPEQFRVPSRFYGREEEIGTLLRVYDEAAAGHTRLLLVAGPSGIGKTSLVHETKKKISEQRGYFVAGKCDQLQRDVPLSPVLRGLRGLARQLVAEPASHLERWSARIREALGPNGAVLTAVIPELEWIIGPQKPVPDLRPLEAQHRFHDALESFLDVFTRADHPLVLFLDDLQWADAATLRLVRLLVGGRHARRLLIVGSYRDEVVDQAHPVAALGADLRRAGIDVPAIALGSIRVEDVRDLLADALHTSAADVQPLAEIVHAKTDGNPFFILQFIDVLQREGIVRFEPERGAWAWDLGRARGQAGTDNVLTFLVRRIAARDDETKHLLRLAACVGDTFDLATLCVVSEMPAEHVARRLWTAIEDGLLVPIGGGYSAFSGASLPPVDGEREAVSGRYRFPHDRVRQAAYELVPEAERRSVHLRIARLLVSAAAGRPLARDELFAITTHFETAADAVADPQERLAVARLELDAGRLTKRAAAYEGAAHFLRCARARLGDGAWDSDYALASEIHRELAECEWLAGHRDRSEALFATTSSRARSDVERAAIAHIQIVQYTNDGKAAEAIAAGVSGLRAVGLRLAARCSVLLVAWALVQARLALAGGVVRRDRLATGSRDPARDARLRLIVALAAPAYELANQNLYAFTILYGVTQAVRHGGSTDDVAYAIATYGALRAAIFRQYDDAHRLIEAARAVAAQSRDCTNRGRIEYIAGYFVLPWNAPLAETIGVLETAATRCVEDGDITFAVYCLVNAGSYAFCLGADLGAPLAMRERFDALLRKRDDVAMRFTNANLCNTCDRLAGADGASLDIVDAEFGGGEDITGSPAATGLTAAVGLLYKAQLVYLLGDPREALGWIDRAAAQRKALVGTAYLAYIALYEALVMAECWSAAPGSRRRFRRAMARAERDLALWARRVPATFGHLLGLVRAERARVRGERERAWTFYDEAIAAARRERAPLYVALASERAGSLWREAGRDAIARLYLSDAHDAYAAWGAARKARQVLARHPDLLARTRFASASDAGASVQARAAPSVAELPSSLAVLDVQAIFKAAEALTTEFDLERLLRKMIRVVLEVAGARRGVLLLPDGERGLRPRAEGRVEGNGLAIEIFAADAGDAAAPVCPSVVQFAVRSRDLVVVDDATTAEAFRDDAYVRSAKSRSLLCVPLVQRAKLAAVLHLENGLVTGAFAPQLVEILRLLASQLAICIENASLYESLERRVADRTRELETANRRIRQLLDDMREGILVFDEHGRVEGDVSRRAREMFPGVAAGASVRALLFPDAASTDAAAVVFDEWLAEVFAAPLEVVGELALLAPPEAVLRRGGPDETWLSLDFRPIVAGGRVARVMLLATDDTARRRIEHEASARDREHAEQMAAMRRLVSGAAATFVSFLATSAERLQRLESLGALPGAPDRARVEQLFQIAHTLHGESRTFELARVASACAAIEEDLVELRRGAPPERAASAVRTLQAHVAAIREALEEARRAFIAASPSGAAALEEVPVDRRMLARLLELVAEREDEVARVALGLAARPFGEIVARLAESTPRWAKAAGKLVDLTTEGRDVRVPPALARCLGGALMHLVRNALSHGIEAPEERRRKNKPPVGAIRLACVEGSAGPTVTVEDDGAGVDLEALCARAAASGVTVLPGRELELVFAPGVSTAAAGDDLAGRGVGMAAVRSDVEEASYTIAIATTRGAGTRFTIGPRADR
jgi:predicted ATPase/HPt (histidine-containing phosphotransfer) domain-containing protein